jgi:hypothetical protein
LSTIKYFFKIAFFLFWSFEFGTQTNGKRLKQKVQSLKYEQSPQRIPFSDSVFSIAHTFSFVLDTLYFL